ncbi:alanine racemase [uncultured Ilyobacter sp.]|uniref:alanine racemase n=1 Tax=uncultured Ilyobacter sp. TaxID=544433 RepID=UPI0029C96E35|nr:alanine racemase [uncultured Ilyobacter sp.]
MRAWADINLDNLIYNLNRIKEFAGTKKIMGVIKADGYGMGAVECARILSENGVENFGVACYEEGYELYKAGIEGEILLLGATPFENIEDAVNCGFQITISSFEQIEFLQRNNLHPEVHIKVDTGMGRLGFSHEEAIEAIKMIKDKNIADVVGVYSHLSVADMPEKDDFTLDQIEKFKVFEKMESIKYKHILNSSGLLRFSDATDTNLVRVGIILHGVVPFESELQKKFKPVFSFKTKIVFLKNIIEKTYISYGNTETAEPGDLIATIAVGYADGFIREFSNGGTVEIDGVACRVIGKICMDMTMIKIPDELKNRVHVGTEVTIIGKNILKKAECIGTIPYEIMIGLGRRVTRFYIKNGKVLKLKSLQESETKEFQKG